MHAIFRFSLLFLCLSSCFHANATNYYLSSSGNDGNNGLSTASAWQSLAYLNSQIPTMQPGDQILFRRGDTFIGELELNNSGSNSARIIIDAYGTGNLPILKGAIPVSSWSVYSGNIYRAPITQSVKGLYVDGKRMTKARYPNTGWLFTDTGSGTSGFGDADIPQATNYWTGATARIRSVDWQYEIREIQSHSGSDIIFQNATEYGIDPDWGYYLDNKLEALDVAGEWFYDNTGSFLYLYAPGGVNPNSLLVEAVVYDTGIECAFNSEYLTVQNLRITQYAVQGFWLGGVCQEVTVNTCEISQIGMNAIHLDVFPGTNILVSGNDISDAEGRGIYLFDGDNCEISGNTLKRIGMVPGYGLSDVNGGVGILCYDGTSNSLIANNHIDSTGYAGIRVDGSDNVIEYNRVHNAILTLSDGGGIYCYGVNTQDNIIRYNWVKNVIGNVESSPNSPFAMGIYVDNFCTGITVSNNIVTGVTNFGLLNNFNTNNNTFTNNLVYGNGDGGLMMDDKANAVNTGNTVSGNTFYCLGKDQIPMLLIAEYANPNWGAFDNNRYYNPYSCTAVATKYDAGSGFEWTYFGLSHWKSDKGLDINSTASIVSWNEYEPTTTVGGEMISNPEFTSNVNGWGSWPGNNAMAWSNTAGLDGGSMAFTMLANTPETYGIAHTQNFALTANKWYQLSMSTKGVGYGDLRVNVRETIGFNNTEFAERCALDPNNRQDVSFVFQIPTSYSQARMDFAVDFTTGGFFLDNARLNEVEVEYLDPEMRSRLFVNHSNSTQNITFQDSLFTDLAGTAMPTLSLAPWSSAVLLYTGATSAPFPIELLYFEVDCSQPQPVLSWETGGSGSGNRIAVERSASGEQWQEVGEVPHSETGSFAWQDATPLEGAALYRLRLIDSDNQSRVFSPVWADCQKAATTDIKAFPNPLSPGQFIQIEAPANKPLRLSTLNGHVLRKWDTPQDASRSLNTDRLQAGIYLLYSQGSTPIKVLIMD